MLEQAHREQLPHKPTDGSWRSQWTCRGRDGFQHSSGNPIGKRPHHPHAISTINCLLGPGAAQASDCREQDLDRRSKLVADPVRPRKNIQQVCRRNKSPLIRKVRHRFQGELSGKAVNHRYVGRRLSCDPRRGRGHGSTASALAVTALPGKGQNKNYQQG